MMLRLDTSRHPWTLRQKLWRGVWMLVWTMFGQPGPRVFSPWRSLLLRAFGARIGRGVKVCGRVKVLMPWNLELGDFAVLAERVDVYNFAQVTIGAQSCISQGSWLCTGSHDHSLPDFPLYWKPISIGSSVWIAAEAFLHPGTQVGDGAVVGARAVVAGVLEPWTIYAGNPGRRVGPRRIRPIPEVAPRASGA